MPPLRNLVVEMFDDSPELVMLLRVTLRFSGHRITLRHAGAPPTSGEAVRDLIATSRPDVVVWNLSPVLSRQCRLLEALLETHAHGQSGLVVTTSNAPRVREYLGAMAWDVRILQTPYDADDFARALDRAAGARAPRCTAEVDFGPEA